MRLPAGFVRRHSRAKILLGLSIEMEANLLVQAALHGVTSAE
jgi:hypothetical protein